MPIGDIPSGRSNTGFYISTNEKPEYLLLFREANGTEIAKFTLPVEKANAKVLYSNADVSVAIENGVATEKFSKPRSYAFIKLG